MKILNNTLMEPFFAKVILITLQHAIYMII